VHCKGAHIFTNYDKKIFKLAVLLWVQDYKYTTLEILNTIEGLGTAKVPTESLDSYKPVKYWSSARAEA